MEITNIDYDGIRKILISNEKKRFQYTRMMLWKWNF